MYTTLSFPPTFFPPQLSQLIPDCIQASTAVGIGLITALAGATEVGLVVRGTYTVLDMGEPTPQIFICIGAIIVVAVMLHFHVKGAFCIGLFFGMKFPCLKSFTTYLIYKLHWNSLGTFVQWMVDKSWPREIALAPYVDEDFAHDFKPSVVLLLFNLTFLYILTLNGLARSMSDLAQLTKKDGKSRCNIKPEWSQLNQDFNPKVLFRVVDGSSSYAVCLLF